MHILSDGTDASKVNPLTLPTSLPYSRAYIWVEDRSDGRIRPNYHL
jgi:hypothetical protein